MGKPSSTRSPGQKLIPVPVGDEFIGKVDQGLQKLGYGNRAQFIRDAIFEKLKQSGRQLHPGLAQAPSRLGKGGPRKRSRK